MSKSIIKAAKYVSPNLERVLEFGVHHGGSSSLLRSLLSSNYKIFGFDSFIGLPEDWIGADIYKGGFNVDGVVPNFEGVTFIKGWFKDTIPEFINEYGHKQCALIHFDCDLYSSSKTIFEYMTPSIGPDTILVFDEWFFNAGENRNDNSGEQKAFYEWVLENRIDYTFIETENDYSGYCEEKTVLIK